MLRSRIYELDVLRGFAIFLMMIFHFSYDLTMFRFVEIDFLNDPFWVSFRVLIVSIFLSVVGMGLYVAYHKEILFNKLIRRSVILLLASIVVSLGTFFMFPSQWIFFGIIHFILLASIVAVFFVKIPFTAFIVGITIVGLSFFDYINLNFLMDYTRELFNLPYQTMDLVPFFPWLGVVLIGIYLQYQNLYSFKFKNSIIKNILAYMGKHSLLIYLIHQPILYGLVMGYFTINSL